MSGLRKLLGGLGAALARAAAAHAPSPSLGATLAAAGQRGVAPAASAAAALPAAPARSLCSAAAVSCSMRSVVSSSSSSSSSSSGLFTPWGCRAAQTCRPGAAAASSQPWLAQLRQRTTAAHLVPKFKGGKIKPYSSFRRRFKLTASGKVLYPRPGHVHKRFNKTKRQLFDLSGKASLTPAYARVVRKIGFKLRRF